MIRNNLLGGGEGGGMVNQGPWIYIVPVFMTPWDVWGFGYLSPTEALEKLILPLPQWFVYTQLNIWISVEVVTQFLQSGFDQISHHRKMRYLIRWRREIYSAPPEIGWWSSCSSLGLLTCHSCEGDLSIKRWCMWLGWDIGACDGLI